MPTTSYPVRVEGHLDAPLSRWRWLVKWLLALPHVVVLAVLWLAFTALSLVAMVAIVATGRYPRSIFEFNVGVLRWTWRVHYYAYSALGTDRYPPFTLDDVPDYPARLEVAYPEQLSRVLALVKWWLLAIPHYLVVGLFVSGGWFFLSGDADSGGLIAVLVLVAAVVLLFTGTYPRQIFDLVLGLNRWVLRVVAYAGLMTDEYPPFRLDLGESEPPGVLSVTPPPAPMPGPAPDAATVTNHWGPGRIIATAVGALLLMTSVGLLLGGSVATWADRAGRDSSGFLTSGEERFTTEAYAIESDAVELRGGWLPRAMLDRVRVRVTPRDGQEVFVGVARSSDVDAYLAGVARSRVDDWGAGTLTTTAGAAPVQRPAATHIWSASVAGTGTQSLEWPVTDGSWTVVAMNVDATAGVDIEVDVGVHAPDLGVLGLVLLLGGLVTFACGAVTIAAVSR